jgi:hypothetical protein
MSALIQHQHHYPLAVYPPCWTALEQPQQQPVQSLDHVRVELDLTQDVLRVSNTALHAALADNAYLAAENRVLRIELEVRELAAQIKVMRLQIAVMGDDNRLELSDALKELEQQLRKANLKLEAAELALSTVIKQQPQGFTLDEN